MPHHYLTPFLLLTLLLPISLSTSPQSCLNNSTYLQQSDFCSCLPQYLGRNCSIPAYEISQKQTTIPLTNHYTFVYFKPEEKVVYRFLLTFCPANKSASDELDIIFFAQEEQKNGDIDLLPRREKEVVEMDVGGAAGCRQILSTVLISIDKKPNEELVKIVLGIKLASTALGTTEQGAQTSQSIVIKCQTNSIFTVSFLATILISFFVIVTVFMLISIIFMIRKKWLQRIHQQQQQLKKLQCVNSLMPSKKYQTLIQQQTQSPNPSLNPSLNNPNSQYDHICSICLCQFAVGQDVRKTPCGHIYHSSCLESWCHAHLNCPICRTNFQREQEMGLVEESLRAEVVNIRQPML